MRITYSVNSCGVEIPYFNPEEHTPDKRHEYVDIRENPALIDGLPEVVQTPELGPFLHTINEVASIFRTFGCHFELFPGETIEVGPPLHEGDEPQTQQTLDFAMSYIYMGFEEFERCKNLDDYYRVCGRLTKYLGLLDAFQWDDSSYDKYEVYLSVETLRMYGEDAGYLLTITCLVRGGDATEASSQCVEMTGSIAGFLGLLTL